MIALGTVVALFEPVLNSKDPKLIYQLCGLSKVNDLIPPRKEIGSSVNSLVIFNELSRKE